MLELSIRARPWPGTHEPPSASERVAQRFERSENALDVVAGHTIRYGVLFYIENLLSEQALHLNGEQLCCDQRNN